MLRHTLSPTPTLVGEGFLSNLSDEPSVYWCVGINFRSEQTVRKRYLWSDNKKTGSVACPPTHLSSSSVAAPSGQLLAAILSKIMFLVKQPSVVYRVLNSDLCPPHDLLHDIESYPIFYDALYYLVSSVPSPCLLNSRKLLFLVAIMHKLPSWIVFSVFTSVSDYVCCLWWLGAVCTSGWYCHDFCAFTFWIRYVFSLQHLQAFSGCFFSHCCIMSCVDEDPVVSMIIIQVNLLALSRPELIAAARLIADRKSATRNKDNCVKVILE